MKELMYIAFFILYFLIANIAVLSIFIFLNLPQTLFWFIFVETALFLLPIALKLFLYKRLA